MTDEPDALPPVPRIVPIRHQRELQSDCRRPRSPIVAKRECARQEIYSTARFAALRLPSPRNARATGQNLGKSNTSRRPVEPASPRLCERKADEHALTKLGIRTAYRANNDMRSAS